MERFVEKDRRKMNLLLHIYRLIPASSGLEGGLIKG